MDRVLQHCELSVGMRLPTHAPLLQARYAGRGALSERRLADPLDDHPATRPHGSRPETFSSRERGKEIPKDHRNLGAGAALWGIIMQIGQARLIALNRAGPPTRRKANQNKKATAHIL